MKREAATHPKLHDLAARLDVPNAHALGLLQGLIWFVADHAIAGDLGKWPDGAIARGSGWEGQPAQFIEALVGAGWVDLSDDHRLVMHDWPHHVERWVLAKLTKLGLEFLPCYYETPEVTAEATAVATAEPTGEPPPDDGNGQAAPTADPTPNRTEPNRTKPNQTRKAAKPRARAKSPPLPWALAGCPQFVEAWTEWWAYRGRRKLTRDATTMQKQLDGLAKLPPLEAAECVQLSLRSGWAGVFPEKQANRGGTSGRTPQRRSQRHRAS